MPAFETGLDIPPGVRYADSVTWVRYTYPFNLTGYPAASIPTGFTDNGLPIGLQVVAGPLKEIDIFAAAAAIEMTRPWADKKPPI